MSHLYTAIAGVLIVAGAGLQDSRGLLDLALDEPADITLENVSVIDALAQISEKTGVEIVLPPDVADLLPHGAETVVRRVVIAGRSLREGLHEMFSPLGMGFIVRRHVVEIVPHDALRCLGRAPTWQELDTLGWLTTLRPGVDAASLEQLQPRVQFQTQAQTGWGQLYESILQVGAGGGDEVLTVACHRLGWDWCLSGERIVITDVADAIRRRLQQTVSLRLNYRSLVEVLQQLGDRVGVPIRIAPAALAAIPTTLRQSFSLNVAHARAEQVLETISANTGLGYLIEPDGVLFYRVDEVPPMAAAAVPGAASARLLADDPYVGKLIVPLDDGTSIEWLIRRSELPPELQRRRDADLARAFEALQRSAPGDRP